MKITRKQKQSAVASLLKNYTHDQLYQVRNCISDIRGIEYSCLSADDDSDDAALNEYLEEIYEGYREDGVDRGIMTEEEFDSIYNVMTDIYDLSPFR